MSQNTSMAVMQQRGTSTASLDHFPTPPWATRALCEWIAPDEGMSVWEPACAEGHMARPLAEYFARVDASDIHDYGFGLRADFLVPWGLAPKLAPTDWIVTNPPFNLAAEFARKGFLVARAGVALLTRIAFLEGAERHRTLFAPTPPTDILQFVERVPMVKGRLDRKASSATAYCWIVWRKEAAAPSSTRFHWIAPCRKRLERDSDYPSESP